MKDSKGFTLIELIVVIAIIAILAVVVTVLIDKPKHDAQTASVKANLQTLRKQSEIFYISNNSSYGNNINSCNSGVFGEEIAHASLVEIAKSIESPREVTCTTSNDGNSWAVLINKLYNSDGPYCYDSSGFAGFGSVTFDGKCVEG